MVNYICPKEAIFILTAEINWNYFTFLWETNKIKPPPNLFRSLRNILYPFTWNCWSGKESSNLVSEIKQISVSLRISSLKSNNLFLIEFILRWPIIRFLEYLDVVDGENSRCHHMYIYNNFIYLFLWKCEKL